VGIYWVPGHAGVRGNETANRHVRNGSASGYVGPELALGVSRQDLRSKINRWLGNQHQRQWWNLGDSQQQARELISGLFRGTRVRLLSFTRVQSRVVTELLTRHNILRRHLHIMRLMDSPLCRKCGAEVETSVHIVCRCEALASIRCAYLGSPFLEPEDIKSHTLGAIWCFSKAAGLP
jgi:predicted Zn-ribbon and HTH transcriptional regulator